MRTQLFLMHFAGGNSYSFNFMAPELKKHFDLHSIELPGRGKRMGEDLIKTHDEAIADLLGQIQMRRNGKPFLIYGHSMGALFGYHVTQELEKNGDAPEHIILTGNPGPNVEREEPWHALPQKEFFENLKELGGIPLEFFESEELMEFFEPIIRADFELVEKSNLFSNKTPIKTSIKAYMGIDEERSDQIENWNNYTTGNCQTELLAGDHFFIHNHTELLVNSITSLNDNYKVF